MKRVAFLFLIALQPLFFMDFLQNHIEALIFCAPEPVTVVQIQQCLSEMFDTNIDTQVIEQALCCIQEKYEADIYPFQVYHIGGGYQFLTKPAYQASIGILLRQQSKKRLSKAALETLAIIAYKQPITKTEIEQIRGVNCDYALQRLLEKGLIVIKGKADTLGRPLLYATSQKFMDYFGINSLQELPQPKDFKEGQEIGESNGHV